MAKLYVTEYANPAISSGNIASAASVPVVTDQTPVSFSTSTQSAAFSAITNLVRIHTDGICSIAFGSNPTATTNNQRMVAGQTEYFYIPQGQSFKVAAITNT